MRQDLRLLIPLFRIQLRLVLYVFLLSFSLVFLLSRYRSHVSVPSLRPEPWRQLCASQEVFPLDTYVETEPVGILLGVMSTSGPAGAQRRKEIRESWASHWASRGRWEEGQFWTVEESERMRMTARNGILNPTSRVVVRFVVGRPDSRSALSTLSEEQEKHDDIIVLPIKENADSGKTFAFFDWSFRHALVPPPTHSRNETSRETPRREKRDLDDRSFDDAEHPHGWALINAFGRRPPAAHDPANPVDGKAFVSKEDWVRPDFVVKAHDDSFIMLAELEARLRVLPRKGVYWGHSTEERGVKYHSGEAYALSWDLVGHVSTFARKNQHPSGRKLTRPNTWWNNRYKPGGDVAADAHPNQPAGRGGRGRGRRKYQNLALRITGREDQLTATWMREHGREWGVGAWQEERCWMYDHPAATTVRSRGFTFPHEITTERASSVELRAQDAGYSTVVRGGRRYAHPRWDDASAIGAGTTIRHRMDGVSGLREQVRAMEGDALVEGSELSVHVRRPDWRGEEAVERWREDMKLGWRGRHLLSPLDPSRTESESSKAQSRPGLTLPLPIGGTVLVHYARTNEQWEECVEVLLESWPLERRLRHSRLLD